LVLDGDIEFVLRRMRVTDLDEVLAIERECFSNPWPENTFRGEIQNEGISHPMVALEKATGRLIGYVIYWLVQDEVQINNVAVHPDFRRRHVAEAMMNLILEDARTKGGMYAVLEVRLSNVAARTLYEKKLGFVFLDIRTAYYTNPVEDALVLGLPL
jgi:[ribosomal protein S18]-alanine N-acetyltransferase